LSDLDPAQWRELRQVFADLVELLPAEREERLAQLPPEDAARVRDLLAAAATDTNELLGEGAVGAVAAAVLADLGERAGGDDGEGDQPAVAGTPLGPWRLERPLGRGGMAEVWEARRVDGQYEQTVAVKVLKRGMDSAEIVRRFLRERQILARLDHPGIARLFDGGLGPDGRPYFVLERVEGEPITDWCARRELDVPARLRLLVDCCEAVAAAHRQLVVHRDLKPSNILVTADGAVKLLDFGIAKVLAGEDGAGEATRAEVRVLTPAYAAPEQILGEPVSTATDVYALGVLAYELLTGRLPHQCSGRRAAELASAVAGESIARPSTAVVETAAADPGDAEQTRRRRRLARTLAGDVDTVVMTALRREPQRRYASVAAFAEDLQRFLDGRPIAARPDSFGYRAGKFVGRHRLGVAATTAAAAALVAAAAVALVQADRASREAQRAHAEASRAQTQAQRAEQQAARAERVRSFLTSIFAVSDPVRARGEVVTARALLDEGVRRVDGELAREPALRGEMLDLLAGLYRKLGELDVAKGLAERSLQLRAATHGAESAEAAKSEWTLGWVLANQGEMEPARQRLGHAIAVLDRVEGPNSLAAADAREPLVELTFAAEGPAATLAVAERRLATYRAVAGERDERTARALSDVGVVLAELDRLPEAEAAYRQSMAVLDAVLPADDPRAAYPHNNLAGLLLDTGRAAEGEREIRRAIEIRDKSLGGEHPDTIASRGLLVQVLIAVDRLPEAEQQARQALAAAEGRDRFNATQMRGSLGQVLLRQERYAEALRLFEQAIVERRGMLPDDHVLTFAIRINRARALVGLGRRAEARTALAAMIPQLEAKGAEGAQYVTRAREVLALASGG
jgi:serine/threonine-protein kinase